MYLGCKNIKTLRLCRLKQPSEFIIQPALGINYCARENEVKKISMPCWCCKTSYLWNTLVWCVKHCIYAPQYNANSQSEKMTFSTDDTTISVMEFGSKIGTMPSQHWRKCHKVSKLSCGPKILIMWFTYHTTGYLWNICSMHNRNIIDMYLNKVLIINQNRIFSADVTTIIVTEFRSKIRPLSSQHWTRCHVPELTKT